MLKQFSGALNNIDKDDNTFHFDSFHQKFSRRSVLIKYSQMNADLV
ncbi:hypothetical protein [Pollutibacter soli]